VPASLPTEEQVSAGGVAFRRTEAGVEVALVRVRPQGRWQLPKGLVDAGETPEQAALREVREEAGVETEPITPLDVVEYWYVGDRRGVRVRFHKRVHFFLLAYRAGGVRDHDREVEEARWVPVEEAERMLAFPNERKVVERARAFLAAEGRAQPGGGGAGGSSTAA
jgi:8-oxo-dGTP pyrophosphatase MutT (NUDIX family)